MSQSPLAVGFDLDYTLWDQDAFARSFFEELAEEWGDRLGRCREDVLRVFRSTHERLTLGHPRLFDEALRELGGWTPVRVEELVQRYHRHRPPASAYPGAEPLLERLAGSGMLLFLVTDGHSGTQRHKVEALGLGPRFTRMVFTGDFQPAWRKPSCFPFLFACGGLGVDLARCVYVGDNPLCDFQGPRQLGMTTVGVATGPFANLPVPPHQAPHLRIAAISELEAVL
jgi:putative hydrolase of the HAD superfamily